MLKAISIDYNKTGILSNIMEDYLSGNKTLIPFYGELPNIDSFEKQIELKSKQPINRTVLYKVLTKQYRNIEKSKITSQNIDLLKSNNTFTVTTGHQLCLFTGPLYFLYKIITTINLAEQLTLKYPKQNFVPIYWMATEDHDFEEINFLNVFNKKVSWEEDSQQGAVGEFNTQSLTTVYSELKTILGDSNFATELLDLFKEAYIENKNLAEASRHLVNKLFGKYGLVIVDGNNSELKTAFLKVAEGDIFNQKTFINVKTTNEQLEKKYKLKVNPREINFFYLLKGVRERIIQVDENTFEIVNTNLRFTANQLKKELQLHPEKFSPNVVLRPQYQETILPNLAYIGGGGELGYWLQFKQSFKSNNIPFPVLVLRNSVLVINKNEQQKLSKLNIDIQDVFLTKDELIKKLVVSNLDFDFEAENNTINLLFDEVLEKIIAVDATLEATALSEKQKALNGLQKLEDKVLKAQKRNQDTSVSQIEKIKEKLFPNNNLQERETNFSEFHLKWGSSFIEILKNNLNPFSEFTILVEE